MVKEEDLVDEISHASFTIDENPVEAIGRILADDGASNDVIEDEGGDALSVVLDPSAAEGMENILDLEVGVPLHNETTTVDDCDIEECETGYLMLNCKRQVPNCCAICLCPYDVDDAVVWSSNQACKHAFHEDCMVDWLTKMQNGTPCPCCRQEFTDLESSARPQRKYRGLPSLLIRTQSHCDSTSHYCYNRAVLF